MDRRLFWGLFGLWAVAYLGSIVVVQVTEPTGDGFTRGLNRITAFLGWQIFAAVLAVIVWIAGNSLPKGSQLRLVSRIPAILAAVLMMVVAGVILFVGARTTPPEGAVHWPPQIEMARADMGTAEKPPGVFTAPPPT